MSGPQGHDPNQPWGQQPYNEPAWQQQPATPEQATTAAPIWQPQGYQPPQQYGGGYDAGQQAGGGYPGYGQADPYGQQAPSYDQAAYGGQSAQPTTFGQQPPPYGQPFQPYGGAAPGGAPKKKSGALIGGIVAAVVAVIAIVAVLGFWVPGWFVTTKLDVNAAQTGVAQILGDEANGYGAKNVKDVTCNNGQNPTVKKGDTFDCEVSIDGTKRKVTVTFQDSKGTYEVGRPK